MMARSLATDKSRTGKMRWPVSIGNHRSVSGSSAARVSESSAVTSAFDGGCEALLSLVGINVWEASPSPVVDKVWKALPSLAAFSAVVVSPLAVASWAVMLDMLLMVTRMRFSWPLMMWCCWIHGTLLS